MTPSPRPLRGRLIFGALVSLATFGVIELAARLAAGPPPPAVNVYTAVGEKEQYLTVSSGTAQTTYQNWYAEPPFPLQTDRPRLAFFGGSSVHGGVQQMSPSLEFPDLIGQMLGAEVLNLATPGLDSHDTVRIMEEMSAAKVDAYVVFDGHNDFGNIYFNARYADATAGFRAYTRAFFEHSRLYTLMRAGIYPPSGHARDRMSAEGIAVTPAQKEVALQGFRANLHRMAWLAHTAEVPLILGTPLSCLRGAAGELPCAEQPCAADLWRQAQQIPPQQAEQKAELLWRALDADPVPLRAPRSAIEVVREVAADEGATLVDVVAQWPIDRSFGVPDCSGFADPVHFNAMGHRAMAQLFAPAVQQALQQER